MTPGFCSLRLAQNLIRSPISHGVVVFALLWLPTLWLPLGRDQGLWAAIADQINRGGSVYADGITLKPPGITYLYTWTLGLWHSMRAIRVLDLAWLSATLVFMILLVPRPSRRLLGPVLGVLFGVTHFYAFTYWEMASPDVFIALPVVAAVWMQLSRRPSHEIARRVSIGLLYAVAFWLKYPALLLVAMVPALDLFGPDGLRSRRLGKLMTGWCFSGLGFLIGIAIVLLEITASGAFEAFREVQVDYLLGYAGYRSIPGQADLQWSGFSTHVALESLQTFFYCVPYLLLPAVLVSSLWPRSKGDAVEARALWPFWLAALLSLGSTVVQKKFFLAHFGPTIPWLCLLAGFGIERASSWLAERSEIEDEKARLRLRAVLVGLMLVCLLPISHALLDRTSQMTTWANQLGGGPQDRRAFYEHFGRYRAGDFSFLADAEVAFHLRFNTQPDDSVFVFGFEPLIYFLANRPAASRFMAFTTLTNPAANPAWRQEVLEQLSSHPPEIFITVTHDDLEWLTGVRGDSSVLLGELLPDVSAWLAARYQFEREIEHFTLWRLAPIELGDATATAPATEAAGTPRY